MNVQLELIKVANLIVSLDCEKFNDDYATLLRKYHTMHGPAKRQVKRTLDVMKKRLERDCRQEGRSDDIFVVNRSYDPHYFDTRRGFVFSFLRDGTVLSGKGTTHYWLKSDYLAENPDAPMIATIDGRAGKGGNREGIVVSFWSDKRMSREKKKRLADKLPFKWDKIAIWND
jgi:hypothetical protein